MTLEQLIEKLEAIRRVHPHAECRFLISDERGELEFEISEAEYFTFGKVVLLQS